MEFSHPTSDIWHLLERPQDEQRAIWLASGHDPDGFGAAEWGALHVSQGEEYLADARAKAQAEREGA